MFIRVFRDYGYLENQELGFGVRSFRKWNNTMDVVRTLMRPKITLKYIEEKGNWSKMMRNAD